MSDALLISLVVAACGIINAGIVFGGFWLQRGKSEGQVMVEAAQGSVLAAKALARAESLAGEVAEWRVETAASIARVRTIAEMQMTGLTAAETRLAKSIDDMGERFEKLSTRLDRFLEVQSKD
jgi:hypothetical protein